MSAAGTNARPRLGIRLIPIDKLDLRVDANARQILVTTPTGNFRVTYAPNSIQLAVQSEWSDRTVSPAELGRLRQHAWWLANDAAHELGWL
jgi:hypothetical protein